jgi:GAF domain-containing protein
VIPIIVDDNVFGVLDLDAPIINRFKEADQIALEKAVSVFVELIRLGDDL